MKKIRQLIPQWAINYFKHLPLSVFASLFYCFPSHKLKIIGVTGTDGKTTTVELIYYILKKANLPVAMVSTVSAKIGAEEIDTGFHVTAPNPWLLQKLLRSMVEKKIKYVVLEATSHGLDQFRLWGINFAAAVLTNVTHEHLDYHKTFGNYRLAKLKALLRAKIVILNRDDDSFGFFFNNLQNKGVKIVTYGVENNADFTPTNFIFTTKLPGDYNQYNCLAAIAAGSLFRAEKTVIQKAVSSFNGVAGRMEEISEGQPFRAIVDFAHTPNALKRVLETLRGQLKAKGRLIAVFGAAGERDREKRPLMGKVACRLADFVILTAEDPRTENAEDICQQIAVGCKEVDGKPEIILDRTSAIKIACQKAKKDDIVVICGKGHEKSMCFGEKEYPWSDQETVRNVLKERSPA